MRRVLSRPQCQLRTDPSARRSARSEPSRRSGSPSWGHGLSRSGRRLPLVGHKTGIDGAGAGARCLRRVGV